MMGNILSRWWVMVAVVAAIAWLFGFVIGVVVGHWFARPVY